MAYNTIKFVLRTFLLQYVVVLKFKYCFEQIYQRIGILIVKTLNTEGICICQKSLKLSFIVKYMHLSVL